MATPVVFYPFPRLPSRTPSLMLPRSSFVALAAFLTIALVFVLRPFSVPSSYYRDVFDQGRSLTTWLSAEEARYAALLQQRRQLIKKWGPTEVDVESYPTHRELYTMWDFFIPAFQCPHRVERIGTLGDGGKWVCGMDRLAKQDKCVIYSFGVNDESSFESSLLKRAPGCEVWGYDYSVNSWGPEITGDPELRHRAHFSPWALGGTDNHQESDNPKWWTLDSLMKLNGHTFIDVLKIDIEGGEFDALVSFIAAHAQEGELPVGQVQLEIHAQGDRGRFDYFVKWWESLEAVGLRPFWTEPNLVYINIVRGVLPELAEYSFINIRGNHALVNEAFN
ncbi:methyltransferase domain-containing protein [Russula earlei]|uniref:Methyltransferase domain-containing protein n=1 Tax=Russula earlei TaxID=71964 RepID=A0ACC0U0B3_9AGAM|nr:methyltransferase domain-containing protein [Russula earlei]